MITTSVCFVAPGTSCSVIEDDIRRNDQHAEWVRWQERPISERTGTIPSPGFKDCIRCPLRAGCDSEAERRSICSECPYGSLPVSPSLDFHRASVWNALPESVVARYAEDLDFSTLMDIGRYADWIRSKRLG